MVYDGVVEMLQTCRRHHTSSDISSGFDTPIMLRLIAAAAQTQHKATWYLVIF